MRLKLPKKLSAGCKVEQEGNVFPNNHNTSDHDRLLQSIYARYEIHERRMRDDPIYRKAQRKEAKRFMLYMILRDRGTRLYYIQKPITLLKGHLMSMKKGALYHKAP